jgi:hypothetical protein
MKAQLVPKTNRRIKKSRKALLSKEKNFCKGQSARQAAGARQGASVHYFEPEKCLIKNNLFESLGKAGNRQNSLF